MSGHDHHESLPGYSPAQLLHAGCRECDRRAATLDGGLAHLDAVQFARAWHRAALWRQGGGQLPDLDRAEMRMLAALWEVQVKLEPHGWPVGMIPVNWYAPPQMLTAPPGLAAEIREGLAAADRGQTVDLGSFEQYLDGDQE